MISRAGSFSRTAQPLAVHQLGPRGLERVGCALVLAQRALEKHVEVAVAREQRLAAKRAGERPGLTLRLGGLEEGTGGTRRVVGASEPGVELDELGDR